MFRFFSVSVAYTLVSGIAGGILLALFWQPLVFSAATGVGETVKDNMNVFQAFVLGMVQGLTEFIPISSTAHLKVIPVALGWGDPGVTFSAIIQLGSIVAVLWYFWEDLTQVVKGVIKSVAQKRYETLEFKMGVGIVVGTIPIVIGGLLLKLLVKDLDNSAFRSMTTIALASLLMASLLALAEKFAQPKRTWESLSAWDGILIGLAQTLALIPGVSRSGSTITAALFLNLQRSTAARFSFLLGIPAITLAGLVELKEVFATSFPSHQIFPLLVALLSSTVFSYLSIAWLIRYLQKQSTWVFVWYRFAFGIAILVAEALKGV